MKLKKVRQLNHSPSHFQRTIKDHRKKTVMRIKKNKHSNRNKNKNKKMKMLPMRKKFFLMMLNHKLLN